MYIQTYNERFMRKLLSSGDNIILSILDKIDNVENIKEVPYGYKFLFNNQKYEISVEEILFSRYYFYLNGKEISSSNVICGRLYKQIKRKYKSK